MELTEEQLSKAVALLVATGASKCSVCGSESMSVDRFVFELRPFAFGMISTEGPILPVIPAQCPICGQVVLFNAVELGIVPTDAEGEVVS